MSTITSDTRLVLFLADEVNLRLVVVWPEVVRISSSSLVSSKDVSSIAPAAKRIDMMELAETATLMLSADAREMLQRVVMLVSLGLLHTDGSVDQAVCEFIERLALAKMAGLGAFDSEKVAAKFLLGMSVDARLEWLVSNNLLEG